MRTRTCRAAGARRAAADARLEGGEPWHPEADKLAGWQLQDDAAEVIELLRRRGMSVSSPTGNKKGAFWAIEWDGERFVSAAYREPATANVA